MYILRVPARVVIVLSLALLVGCGASMDDPDGGALDATARDDAALRRDGGVIRLPDAGPRVDAGPVRGAPYPIVLAHGFFGFDDFAGVGFVTYFYEVREELAARGETEVFTPTVDPFNDSVTRGEQLAAAVEAILEETGAPRVNLIGHSQGGLDVRYVAATHPEWVASATTFASPNRGTPVADVVVGLVEDGRFRGLVDQLVRLFGAPIWDAAGEETSLFRALEQMSSLGMEAFNTAYPNDPSVSYYSVTGRTDREPGGSDCEATDIPPFVSRYMRTVDPVDPLLDIAEQIVDGGSEDIVNDGLIRVRDARWGRFLGCIPADHLDQVGQLLGDNPGFRNDFEYRQFYADLVAFLRSEGH